MGVNNFWKIKINNKEQTLNKSIKDLGYIISIKDLYNKCIAIDASIVIYQSLFGGLRFTKYEDSYLIILERKIKKYIRNNVKQIWVFDNKKGNVSKTECDYGKHISSIQLNSEHVHKTIKLLKKYKIPYIESPIDIEAEQICVNLIHNKQCDYILTCDSDALIFNGPQDRTILVKGKGNNYIAYNLHSILSNGKLTYNQLVKVCVALGTDFNKKIPNVGPTTVIKKVKNNKLKFTKKQLDVIKMYAMHI